MIGGRDVGATFDLDAGDVVVGRERGCDVRLTDRSISRRHATFRFEGLDWVVEDLGSRNGVHVGGERVERAVLTDLTEVLLGDVPVRFRVAEEERAEPLPLLHADADPIVLDDEIVLEDDDAPPAIAPIPRRAAPDPAPTAPRPAPPSTLTGNELRRAEILAEGKRAGLLSGDLAQQPTWVRCILGVLLVAAAGGIAFGMLRLVQSMRATL